MTEKRSSCVPPGIRQALEAQIAAGKENPLARLTLGRIMASEEDFESAVRHLSRAIELDSEYSAAYAALGKACLRTGDTARAMDVFARGAAIAERKGDLQAARQMDILHKKLVRKAG